MINSAVIPFNTQLKRVLLLYPYWPLERLLEALMSYLWHTVIYAEQKLMHLTWRSVTNIYCIWVDSWTHCSPFRCFFLLVCFSDEWNGGDKILECWGNSFQENKHPIVPSLVDVDPCHFSRNITNMLFYLSTANQLCKLSVRMDSKCTWNFRKGCRYVCQLSLHRNAEHLPSLIAPSVNLVRYRAVITGGAVWAAAVPDEECKHTRSSSKNSQLRVFLECPNEPSPLCLQFQADGKPAICLASVSLSGLPRGHTHTNGGVLSPER